MDKKEKSFEDNLSDLRLAIDKLESSECSLEESMMLYKDAIDTAKRCYDIIENAQQEISIINNLGDIVKEN